MHAFFDLQGVKLEQSTFCNSAKPSGTVLGSEHGAHCNRILMCLAKLSIWYLFWKTKKCSSAVTEISGV